jgi:aspartyl-tRNA(Asn)/glutamyl-tRNA(Gln) amidotransferase subunit B
MSDFPNYEPVIGLEVHVQLSTASKAYASDSTDFGALPNTLVSPITLGHPGTLPKANTAVVDYAIQLGLACGCTIREHNLYARKNYFYADLPKGYQITQDATPICTGGGVRIRLSDGTEKTIRLTRIHMEEDTGKSLHDLDPFHTLIDLNRAGVPLLEIVSEADFRTGEEAYQYLSEIRKLVRYLDISDGNMEEGSLRCDVNISVRPVGQEKFGTKVEVKNMNSFRNVQKAIDFETERQIAAIRNGETIFQETRMFDASKGATILMRTKEDAHDYRYFVEPDLPPVVVTPKAIGRIQAELPELPQARFERYQTEWKLTEYDAGLLTENRATADFFESLVAVGCSPKAAANWVMGPIRSWLNERAMPLSEFPLSVAALQALIALVETDTVSFSAAQQRLFPVLLDQPNANAADLAQQLGIVQQKDVQALEAHIDAVLAEWPDKVAEYQAGKKGLIGLFMGEVMKRSGGSADPKTTTTLLRTKLDAGQ